MLAAGRARTQCHRLRARVKARRDAEGWRTGGAGHGIGRRSDRAVSQARDAGCGRHGVQDSRGISRRRNRCGRREAVLRAACRGRRPVGGVVNRVRARIGRHRDRETLRRNVRAAARTQNRRRRLRRTIRKNQLHIRYLRRVAVCRVLIGFDKNVDCVDAVSLIAANVAVYIVARRLEIGPIRQEHEYVTLNAPCGGVEPRFVKASSWPELPCPSSYSSM